MLIFILMVSIGYWCAKLLYPIGGEWLALAGARATALNLSTIYFVKSVAKSPAVEGSRCERDSRDMCGVPRLHAHSSAVRSLSSGAQQLSLVRHLLFWRFSRRWRVHSVVCRSSSGPYSRLALLCCRRLARPEFLRTSPYALHDEGASCSPSYAQRRVAVCRAFR